MVILGDTDVFVVYAAVVIRAHTPDHVLVFFYTSVYCHHQCGVY